MSIVTFNSSVYFHLEADFILGKSDLREDFRLKKLVVDTLWIEEDASISTNDNDNVYVDSNYGNNPHLWIFLDRWEESWHIFKEIRFEINLKLPEIDLTDVDSLKLALTRGPDYFEFGDSFQELYIKKILQPWSESTITWANQPSKSSEYIINTLLFENNKTKIDILSSYENSSNYYGINISGSCIVCLSNMTFESSENDIIENRPKVIIYRSE